MRRALGSLFAMGFLVGVGLALRGERSRPSRRRRAAAPAAEAPDLTDEELAARVRERVAIPADVEVAAVEGAVVLFGRVPRYLVAQLLERVSRVEGVDVIEDRLTPVDLVAPERPPGPPGRA